MLSSGMISLRSNRYYVLILYYPRIRPRSSHLLYRRQHWSYSNFILRRLYNRTHPYAEFFKSAARASSGIHYNSPCSRDTSSVCKVPINKKILGLMALSLPRTCKWCPDSELNQGHGDFQSPALPTELSGQDGGPSWGRTKDRPVMSRLL